MVDVGLLTGTLTLGGSTAFEGISGALLGTFMQDTGVLATYTAGSSAEGITGVAKGNFDMAFVGYLPPGNSLASVPLASRPITIIVHPACPVQAITLQQLQGIASGEICNWAALGGPDEEIVLLGQQPGSGTRQTVEDALVLDSTPQYAALYEGTGALLYAVAHTPGAIGYVSSLTQEAYPVRRLPLLDAEGAPVPLLQSFFLVYRAENAADERIAAFLHYISSANIEGLIAALLPAWGVPYVA